VILKIAALGIFLMLNTNQDKPEIPKETEAYKTTTYVSIL
jgi:hypothetical protein